MKEEKAKYMTALKRNKGNIDEIAIGERLGFTKEQTDKILAILLSEEKIEYRTGEGACNYQVKE